MEFLKNLQVDSAFVHPAKRSAMSTNRDPCMPMFIPVLWAADRTRSGRPLGRPREAGKWILKHSYAEAVCPSTPQASVLILSMAT